MRVVLLNANTSDAITALLLREAKRLVPPGMMLRGVTARLGARYIATRTAYAIAAHAALDAYAEQCGDADAVILACFGDPGLRALQEIATVPVVGMAEAACREAALDGRRFSVVTGGERWPAMLREYIDGLGLGRQLASIRVVAATGAQIASDPDGSLQALVQACERTARDDAADIVILGGAGLAGLAGRIGPLTPIPVVDPLAASIRVVESVLSPHAQPPGLGGPVETIGLRPELSRLMLAGAAD